MPCSTVREMLGMLHVGGAHREYTKLGVKTWLKWCSYKMKLFEEW